jgi:glyoxylase-like metal-dependent hydrolase (beta-lactamase superfamily II)
VTAVPPWQELGNGVFTKRYAFVDQQIGVVVGAEGVALIDTRSSHRQADEIRRDLRALTSQPVTTVINTHGHWDHFFGNHPFRPAPIWGHVKCVAMIERTGERQREKLRRSIPEMADEAAEVVIDPPDRVFEADAIVDVGGRSLELRHLGRGHTDNDIVVLVHDAGVLFAGDLIENGAPPYFGDAYPIDWPATAERLLEVAPAVVVPGHGAVADPAFVAAQLEDLRAIADLGRRVHAGELDLDGAVQLAPFPAEAAREPIERVVGQLRGVF